VLVRVAPWDALGSARKEDVRVRLAVFTMALPGNTHYAPGAGVISRPENQYPPIEGLGPSPPYGAESPHFAAAIVRLSATSSQVDAVIQAYLW